MSYENFICECVNVPIFDEDLREDIIEMTINTRAAMIVPERQLSSTWTIEETIGINSINDDLVRMMSEQIAMDMDTEIINGLLASDRNYYPDSLEGLKWYRENILINRYGFR